MSETPANTPNVNQEIDAASRYKICFLQFIGVIKNIIAKYSAMKPPKTTINPAMIGLAHIAISTKSQYDMISSFIHNTYPHWDKISEEKVQFFIDNSLTNTLGVDPAYHQYLSGFPELFTNNVLDKYEIQDMWVFIKSLIRISISYIHEQRIPALVDGSKRYSNHLYTGREFNIKIKDGPPAEYTTVTERNIKLVKYRKMFKVTFKWPTH